MRNLSSQYVASLREYADESTQRPYVTEASLDLLREEDSQRMRAFIMSQGKG